MLVVGITGSLSSGKSTLAEHLARRGAVWVSADRMGHQLLRKGTPTYRRIVKEFGEDILDARGRIIRRRLGERVFGNPDRLRRLNRIVHPPLLARLRRAIRRLRKAGPGIALIEAALIPEWGIEDELDAVVSVTAPKGKRAWWWKTKTDGTHRAFQARDAGQVAAGRKAANAHFVVRNNGTVKQLKAKADNLWTILGELERPLTSSPRKTIL